MTWNVRLQIRQCEVCQASKRGSPAETTGQLRLYAGCPWQVMAVDLVGLIPLFDRRNTWILVLMDHFTWLADALAIPDASASQSGPDPGSACILLFRSTGEYTCEPGSPVLVPVDGRPLPDTGGGGNQSPITLYQPQRNRVVKSASCRQNGTTVITNGM